MNLSQKSDWFRSWNDWDQSKYWIRKTHIGSHLETNSTLNHPISSSMTNVVCHIMCSQMRGLWMWQISIHWTDGWALILIWPHSKDCSLFRKKLWGSFSDLQWSCLRFNHSKTLLFCTSFDPYLLVVLAEDGYTLIFILLLKPLLFFPNELFPQNQDGKVF